MLKPLAKHIEQSYGNNQSAWGRANDLDRSQVGQFLKAKKPVCVVDGHLVAVLRKVK